MRNFGPIKYNPHYAQMKMRSSGNLSAAQNPQTRRAIWSAHVPAASGQAVAIATTLASEPHNIRHEDGRRQPFPVRQWLKCSNLIRRAE